MYAITSSYGVSGYYNSHMDPSKTHEDGYLQFKGGGNQWTAGGSVYFDYLIDFTKYAGAKIRYSVNPVGSCSPNQCVCTYPNKMSSDMAAPSNTLPLSSATEPTEVEYYFGATEGSGYLTFGFHEVLGNVKGASYCLWRLYDIQLIPV